MFLSGQKMGSGGRLIFSDLVGRRDSGVRNNGIGESEKQYDKKKDAQNWKDKMKQGLGVIRKRRRMRKTCYGGVLSSDVKYYGPVKWWTYGLLESRTHKG